ncbi:galactose-1-phosphate uridylyltransferase [bacterium]|nr:galactose-1-phosphate uridylyltransferase [bacterium]
MSEFRKNPLKNEWVIFSEERSKRPKKEKVTECRFCEGMEIYTPPEIFSISSKNREPDTPGWIIRVVPNKFPVLSPGDNNFIKNEIFYENLDGYGIHEVVINSNRHVKFISQLEEAEIKLILDVFIERISEIKKNKKIKYISIFLNQGEKAGATIEHSHSQIIALPLLPELVKKESNFLKKYYRDKKTCYICDLINVEVKDKVRIIYKDDFFLITPLFYSGYFFEVDFIPVRHMGNFEDINSMEKEVLAKYIKKISNFFLEKFGGNMNMFIKTQPICKNNKDYYHWTLKILPRINNFGGFELSTQMNINTLFPEKTAGVIKEYLNRL